MKHLGGLLVAIFLLIGCRAEPDAQNIMSEVPPPQPSAADPGADDDRRSSAHVLEAAPLPLQQKRDASSNPGACEVQDGSALPGLRLRAIGTEPFWGARIEGRCITYSHPEDQAGTRVWTRFQGIASEGSWSGALNGRPFTLRTRPQADCSDGMSDRRYPIAVSLIVGGEERQGCAEPL